MFSQVQAKVAEFLVDPTLRAAAIVFLAVLAALFTRVILSRVVPFLRVKQKQKLMTK